MISTITAAPGLRPSHFVPAWPFRSSPKEQSLNELQNLLIQKRFFSLQTFKEFQLVLCTGKIVAFVTSAIILIII
jgi:hypothetical protein